MEKIKLIDFEKRKLKRCYLSLLFFTQQIKVRTEGCFAIKTLYILLGTDIGGNRQVIGTYFENTDYNRFWLEVFEHLKSRGIEFVLFLVTPQNKNGNSYSYQILPFYKKIKQIYTVNLKSSKI